jgi:hypothetical protein
MYTPIQQFAAEYAGNWKRFPSFCWSAQPEDPDNWTIVYTSNRDSRLLEQSNAQAIDKRLQSFIATGQVRQEHHKHWACGYLDGYAIQVYDGDQITEALLEWHCIKTALEHYPVLDEMDYGNREYEASLEGIKDSAKYSDMDCDVLDHLPLDWEVHVYEWLATFAPSSLDSVDDSGAYPDSDLIYRAICDLWPEVIPTEPLEPDNDD